MNTFLIDLWHDLKQKRLWPVAVVLTGAIVLVPVLLGKSAADPGEPAPPKGVQTSTPSQLPLVDLEAVPASSKLETFDPHNPFSPARDMPKVDTGVSGSGGGGGGGSGSGGSGGTVSEEVTGAQSGGSGSGSGSGGSTGGGGSPPSGGSGGGTFWFTYEVDVKFGPIDEEKTYKGVKTLQVLPDADDPVVVFMGIKDDGVTALFMVLDPGIEASGEGKCEPSPERCSFIELKAKDSKDEMFLDSATGDDYSLQLIRTKRIKMDEPPERTKTEDTSATRKKSDEDDDEDSPKPFFLPRLFERVTQE